MGKSLTKFLATATLIVAGLGTAFADGSKDMYPAGNAGTYRACIYSGVWDLDPNVAFPFPTNGTMKVYAKSGEHIYLAASNMNNNAARMIWRAPDGTTGTITKANAGGLGIIANRAQELAGPNLPDHTGGYDAYKLTVGAGQEGIWEIDFTSTVTPANSRPGNENNHKVEGWIQDSSYVINAFDISVSNAADDAFISGRAYTTVLNIIINSGNYSYEWHSTFYVLTNTGYLYEVDPNGANGHNTEFFANNKGIQKANSWVGTYDSTGFSATTSVYGGVPRYQSTKDCFNGYRISGTVPVYDPRRPDYVTKTTDADGNEVDYYEDVTHKIFFCKPALDMPETAMCVYGNTICKTWLLNHDNAKDSPKLSDLSLVGKESRLQNVLGPEGMDIYFEANSQGEYTIEMKFDEGYSDRVFHGTCVEGPNVIDWDGKDGAGVFVPDADVILSGSLKTAEIHFPFSDMDNNSNGLYLKQLDATWSRVVRDTMYWDDSALGIAAREGEDPVTMTTGQSSPAHKYTYVANGRGDNTFLDTWTYAQGESTGAQYCTAKSRYIDLAIKDIICDKETARIGELVTYTMQVENKARGSVLYNGMPVVVDADADSASVGVWFPNGGFYTTEVSLISSDDPDCLVIQQPSGEEYGLGFITLKNGHSATVSVKGYAGSKLAHQEILAQGFIMRPGDYFEIDANNRTGDGMPLIPYLKNAEEGEYYGIENDNLLDATKVLFFLNSAPDLQNDAIALSACMDSTGSLFANDVDVDGDAMIVTKYYLTEGSDIAVGTKTDLKDGGTTYASITINADGSFTFEGSPWEGTTPKIYYEVSDQFEGVEKYKTIDLIPGISTSYVQFFVGANTQPTVSIADATIEYNTKVEIPSTLTDPEGAMCTVTISGTGSENFTFDNGKIYYNYSGGATLEETTTYTLTATIDDGCNAPVEKTFNVTVRKNNAPDITPTTASITVKKNANDGNKDVPISFVDEDGDAVTVSTTITGTDKDKFQINGGVLQFKATKGNTNFDGSKAYKIKLTVTDSKGASTTKDVTVNVTTQKNSPSAVTLAVSNGEAVYGTTLNNIVSGLTKSAKNNATNVAGTWTIQNYDGDAILSVGTYNNVKLLFTPTNQNSYRVATATATVTITPKEIEVTSVTADNKEYDGTTTATVSSVAFTGNLASEDASIVTVAATGTFSDVNAADDKTVITSYSLVGSGSSNYKLKNSSGSATANITPKDVTITVDDQSKTFGAANPTFTGSVRGLINNGDLGTVTYSRTSSSEAVGTYTDDITANYDANANYNVTVDKGDFTITPVTEVYELIITGNCDTKTYNGTAQSVTNFTHNGDASFTVTLKSGTSKAEGTNVGNYTMGLTKDMFNVNSTIYSNINVTVVDGALTINPATITISGVSAADKTYDGTTTAVVTPTFSGVQNGESTSVINVTATGTFSDANAGDDKTVTTAYTLTGTGADNYQLASTSGSATADITPKDVTITVNNANKVYGEANPTFTGSVSGLISNGDLGTVTYSRISSSDAVGTYTDDITANYDANANYNVTVDNGDFTISQKELESTDITITVASGTYTYDGTEQKPVVTVKYGDVEIPSTEYEVTYTNNVNAGTATVKITNKSGGNYDIEEKSQTFTIEKATITVSGATVSDKTYDGTTDATITNVAFTGAKNGEGTSVINVTATGTFDDKNAGTAKTVNTEYTLTGTGASNYQLASTTVSTKADITPKDVTITVNNANKVYGAANPTFSGIVDGLINNGDLGTVTYSRTSSSEAAKTYTDDITANFTENANYNVTVDNGDFTITQKELASSDITITVASGTYTYDGTEQKPVVTVKYGDVEIPSTEYEVTYTNNVNAGTATVKITNKSGGNYDIEEKSQTFTIEKATITVSGATVSDKTYDGTTDATITNVAFTGVKNGEGTSVINVAATGTFDDKNVGTGKTVNTAYTLTGTGADNYQLASTTGSATANISAMTITPSAVVSDKEYDGNTTATVTSTSAPEIIAGDNVTVNATSATFADANVGDDKTVTVVYSLSGADMANYQLGTPAESKADIVKSTVQQTVTITGNSETKAFTGSEQSVTGFTHDKTGDASYAVALKSGEKAEAKGTSEGTYSMGLTADMFDVSSTNYSNIKVVIVDGKLVIGSVKASLAYTETTYNGSAQTPAVTVKDLGGNVIDVESNCDVLYTNNTNAGTATVTISPKAGSGYDFAPIELNFTIEPKVLTIGNPAIAEKIYDGTTSTATTAGTLTGVEDGDNVSVSAVGTLSDANAGTDKEVSVVYTLDGADKNNYTIANETATIDVKKAKITVETVAASNKTYDGTADAEISTFTFSGVQNGESKSVINVVATGSFSDKNAGEGKTVTTEYTLTGTGADNYELASTTGSTTATISQKEVALVWSPNPAIFEYDGSSYVVTAIVSPSSLVGSETCTVTGYSDNEKTEAGDYTAIATSLSNTNYKLPSVASQDWSINKSTVAQTIIITGNSDTKTYDGTEKSVESFTHNGTSLGIEVTLKDGNKAIAKGTNAGTYNMGLTADMFNVTSANYSTVTIESVIDGTLTINKKVLTVSGTSVEGKTYDGTTATNTTAGTLVGVVSGDDVTVSAVGTLDDKNAGSKKEVTVAYTLDGDDANNYSIADETKTVDVAKKVLSASGTTVEDKTYDGTTSTTTTLGTVNGVVAGDDVEVSVVGTLSNANAGDDKSVSVVYSISGADANNYVKPDDESLTADVAKKVVSLDWSDNTEFTYDGSSKSVTVDVNGLVGSDVCTAVVSNNEKTDAGSYTAEVTGLSNANYVLPSETTQSWTINKSAEEQIITITGTSVTGTYTGSEQSATGYTHDKTADASYTVSLNEGEKTEIKGTDAGVYAMELTKDMFTVTSTNYSNITVVVEDGILTINKSDVEQSLTIYGTTETMAFTGEEQSITGFTHSKSDDATYTVTLKDGEKAVAKGSAAGTYKMNLTADMFEVSCINYSNIKVTVVDGQLVISNYKVELANDHFTYNGHSQTTDLTVTDQDDNVIPLDELDIKYENNTNAGKGTVTVSPKDGSGYDFNPIIKEFTIDKAVISIAEISGDNKEYDGTTAASTTLGSVAGIVDGDDVTVSAIGTFADKNAGSDKEVTVVYTLSGEDKDNYVVPASETLTGLTISPKQITVSGTTTIGKEYDGTTTAAITLGDVTGICAGDNITVSVEGLFDNKNAGEDKSVTVVYSISGEDAANYAKPEDGTLNATITKKTLTVSGTDVKDKTYDGTTETVTTLGTVSGVVSGDNVEVTAVGTMADKDAGADKSVTVEYVLSGDDMNNYTKPEDETAQITVSKKVVSLDWSDVTEFTYDGTSKSVTVDVDGLVGADICTAIVENNEKTNANTYTAEVTGLSNANYALPSENTTQSWKINQKTIDKEDVEIAFVDADVEIIYDGDEKEPQVIVKDKDGNIVPEDEYIVEYDDNTESGEGTIIIKPTPESNYTFEEVEKPFVIKKANQDAPVVTGNPTSAPGKEDGTINGLTTDMEISSDGGNTWTKVTDINMELPAGDYDVRYADKTNYNASPSTKVTIGETPKTDQDAPVVSGNSTSRPDAEDGTITGLTTEMEISSDGGSTWTKVTDPDMDLPAGTYEVRYAETDTKNASAPTTVEIEKGDKVDQSAPTEIVGNPTSAPGKEDGSISGLTTEMEISTDGENWTVITEPEMELPAGTYYIRYSGNDVFNPSPSKTVVIGETPKTDQYAPVVSGNPTSRPDMEDGTISGLTEEMEISQDGDEWTVVTDPEMELSAGTYYIRYAETDTKNPSEPTTVIIEKGDKVDQSAPTGIAGNPTSRPDKEDGSIEGLTEAMEISIDGDEWTVITDPEMELSAGTYYIRYSGNDVYNPSEPITVIIEKGPKVDQETPVVTGNPVSAPGMEDGSINGLTEEMEISTDGETWTVITDPEMELPAGTYYIRYSGNDVFNPSPSKTVVIGETPKTDQDAPVVTANPTSRPDMEDGTIRGLTIEMEISQDGDEWTVVTDPEMELSAGTYYIRYAETDTKNPSEPTTVIIEKGDKVDQVAPSEIVGNPTSAPGKEDGSISGLTEAMEISLDGENWTVITDPEMELPAGTYYIRYSGTDVFNPSEPITIIIEEGDKLDQAAPTGITSTPTSAPGREDGSIEGLTTEMEISLDGENWTVITDPEMELPAGTYYIRYSGTDVYNPSEPITIIIEEGDKLDQDAPTGITGNPTSRPDKEDGSISGLTTEMEISLDGENWTVIAEPEMELPAGTYYIRYSGTDVYNPSEPVTIIIEKGPKGDQDAPTSVTGNPVSAPGKEDGSINGLTTEMEISTDGETWTVITDPEMELPAGTYYIRYSGNDVFNPSPSKTVVIGETPKTDQDAPVVSGNPTSRPDMEDGTITGLTIEMEISLDGENWTVITDPEMELSAGTYYIRYAETDTKNPSEPTTVIIEKGDKVDQSAPTGIAGNPTSRPDMEDGSIEGLTTEMEISLDSDEWTVITDPEMELAAGTYYIRYAGNDVYNPSEPVTVIIEKGDKVDQTAPVVVGNPTSGPGMSDGSITGLTDEMEISEDGENWTVITDSNMELSSGTYYIRYAGNDVYNPSSATEVTITDTPKTDQDAPVVASQNTSRADKNDGKIEDLTTDMQYSADGGETWTNVTDSNIELPAGEYLVRYAETDTKNPSESVKVIIEKGPKADQEAPSVTGNAISAIGLADGTISDLTTAMEISTDGGETWTDVTNPDMGLAAGEYYVRYSETDVYNASPATKVTIDNAPKTDQEAPGVTGEPTSAPGESDGTITGLTTDMEYSVDGGESWTAVTDPEMNVPAGEYYVRYAETETKNASPATKVTVEDGAEYAVVVDEDSFEVAVAGYCPDTDGEVKFMVVKGEPTEFRTVIVGFESFAIADAQYKSLDENGKFMIYIPDCEAGSYIIQAQFRNAEGNESVVYNFPVQINLTKNYITNIWDDVVSIINKADLDEPENLTKRFKAYQWYRDGELIPGANLPYYNEKGGLQGEYYVEVTTVDDKELRTCSQEWYIVYGDVSLKVYPNPVETVATVELSSDTMIEHTLTITNVAGSNTFLKTTFFGKSTQVDLSDLLSGEYVVVVDGISVKVIKK